MKPDKAAPGSFFAYRLIRAVLFTAYKLFFRFEHFGSENVPDAADPRGVILAPNHVSYLDPPLLGISLKRRVTYLAKEYTLKAFFVGWVLRSAGTLPIKSETDDFKSIRSLIRILKQGCCVVVFPEGTRSPDGRLREAEGGVGFLAVKSDAYVVPVHIDGSYEALPRDAKTFRCHKIRVRFGKAFIPSQEKDLMSAEDPYVAVGRRIMDEIKKLKEACHPERPAIIPWRGVEGSGGNT